MLQIKNLSKKFMLKDKQQLQILADVSFQFEAGKSYAITGVSGSGKSTLLHMLAGLEKPTSGAVFFDGQDIDKFTEQQVDEYLNKSVGIGFQDPFLIKELNVWQNVALKSFQINLDSKKKAEDLLRKFSLQEKSCEYPHTLSGGQLQRVSILRALYNSPKFLLLDEPTGNLDAKHADELVNFILKCKEEWNIGLIISTHDSSVASKMDVVLRLHDCKLSFI